LTDVSLQADLRLGLDKTSLEEVDNKNAKARPTKASACMKMEFEIELSTKRHFSPACLKPDPNTTRIIQSLDRYRDTASAKFCMKATAVLNITATGVYFLNISRVTSFF
jgi:hypothetical protein